MKKKCLIPLTIIVSIIIIVILFLSDFFYFKNCHPTISNYMCNIVTECIGIFITVVIIQNMFNMVKLQKDKNEELDKITRYHNIIFIYMRTYLKYFHCVTTPINKRFEDGIKLEKDFSLNDMQDMYRLSLFVTDNSLQPAIELFFKYEHELRNEFKNVINNIDFKFYPQFLPIITDFIETSLKCNISDGIIKNHVTRLGDELASDFFMKMIAKDDINDFYDKYKANQLPSHGLTIYFMLYDLLKSEQKILKLYLSEIEKLNSNN